MNLCEQACLWKVVDESILTTPTLTDRLSYTQGWRQEFSDGELTLPTRGLKYGFQGTINAKNLRKNRVSPSDGGLAGSDRGL